MATRFKKYVVMCRQEQQKIIPDCPMFSIHFFHDENYLFTFSQYVIKIQRVCGVTYATNGNSLSF